MPRTLFALALAWRSSAAQKLSEDRSLGQNSIDRYGGFGWEADAYALLPWNQGVATMNFSASAGEANGPTNLPECLFLNVVPSTHSCSSTYVSPLRNSSTSTARFPSLL
jgi:hypothetical protein